jgi:phospholipase C
MGLQVCQRVATVAALCLVGIGLFHTAALASDAPNISSISPAFGTTRGGTTVTISGSNFESGAIVTIGGSPLTNVSIHEGLIRGITPQHVAGSADVVVTNPDGQQSTVKATLYNHGFEAGDAQWSISGPGLATVVNKASNAHSGTYYAELSSPAGERVHFFAAKGNEPRYFPVSRGDVITFGGWAYRVSGDGRARWTLEITDAQQRNPVFRGAAPGNVSVERWEMQEGKYTVLADKAFVRLYCEITLNTVPAVARFDDAVLQISPDRANGFTYISPPTLTAIAPNWGAPAGGTTRTVFGSGFTEGSKVTVGENSATNVVVNSANAITFFVPPNSAQVVDVTVTNDEGVSSTLPDAYTYKTPPGPPPGMKKIRHIIYELQENRTFDDYFGRMNKYRADHGINDNAVDGLDLNEALPDAAGHWIKPFHMHTECRENTQPSWNAAHVDYDYGKMDGFMKTGNYFKQSSIIDPDGTRAMGYYDWTDLPYYYSLAFHFATSDRWFSSVLGPTGPNRAYSFAATSLGWISSPKGPSGGFPNLTIFDLLDHAGISWKYYYQNFNPSWIPEWSIYYKDRSKILPLHPNYYNDLQDESTFPQVVFIEENGDKDEHPKPDPGTTGAAASVQHGAQLLSRIIGGLMESPSWSSSVFILTWDEGGGIHDHVVPPSLPEPDGYTPGTKPGDEPGLFNQAGFRVPLIVISPWTGPHQVSHTVRDHTSILKLIETRFGLPPLTARDADADDMREFFNFSTPPWLTPPPLPAQPTNGPCNLNSETAP